MDLDGICTLLNRVHQTLQATAGSSSGSSTAEYVPIPQPEQISNHVYEVWKPAGRSSIELVFFHGLQFEGSKEAYTSTWVSRNKSESWLKWLLEDFPDARILTISYDSRNSSATVGQGRVDNTHTIGERLVNSLVEAANVGQDHCPVVLVGHCLGGLVMKALCSRAHEMFSSNPSDKFLENFLMNVRGLFFYATPHRGSRLADIASQYLQRPLLGDLISLNIATAKRDDSFGILRANYRWMAHGVGETLEVTLGTFRGIVVPEESANQDVDQFYRLVSDHYNICQPVSKQSSSLQLLSNFVGSILKLEEEKLTMGYNPDSLPDNHLLRVLDKWEEKLERAPRLGIVGRGETGKTTLARFVYKKIARRFDYACFLDSVKNKMTEDEKLEDLQAKIMCNLKSRFHIVSNRLKWTDLKGKKVLVILDDAITANQVLVMTEADEFAEGSRVIVTSRKRRFLEQENFEIYAVDELDLQASNNLFCVHAFKRKEAPAAYQELVKRLVLKYKGMPLALKVLGSYLHHLKEALWDDALRDLSAPISPLEGTDSDDEDDDEDELWAKLRVSYDSLLPQEKEMFLDVATCFHSTQLADVKTAWRLSGWAESADSGWQTLVDRCLVTVNSGQVSMSGKLCNLGQSIACPESRYFADHTRVYDITVANQLLSSNQDNSQVKIMKITSQGLQRPHLEVMAFPRLKALRILWLEFVELRGVCESFPSELIYLRIRYWGSTNPDTILPRIFGTISLRYLHLEELDVDFFPDSMGQLSRLEHLELRHFNTLKELRESFGALVGLERLHISDCRRIGRLPTSFGELQNLQQLSIVKCHNLRELPESFGNLQRLQHFSISNCFLLKKLPNSFGQLRALQKLEVSSCQRLKDFTESFGQLQELQDLQIGDCSQLEELPESFGELQSLRRLSIYGCGNLKKLPESFGQLVSLKDVIVQECTSLSGLGLHLWRHQTRKYDVNMQECYEMECFGLTVEQGRFGKMERQRKLKIAACYFVEELPKSVEQFQTLRQLIIVNYGSLRELPECVGRLQSLQRLTISECGSLKCLPESVGQLQALQHLTITGCPSLEEVPESVGQLQALQHLKIELCSSLQKLPESIGQLPALQDLTIAGCVSLAQFPESVGQAPAIQKLTIELCTTLKELPRSIGKLQALQHLTIGSCYSLSSLPKSIGQLRALQHLVIDCCGSLQELQESVGQLQALQHLEISACRKLKSLPKHLDTFCLCNHFFFLNVES